jgi:hypothetical protein
MREGLQLILLLLLARLLLLLTRLVLLLLLLLYLLPSLLRRLQGPLLLTLVLLRLLILLLMGPALRLVAAAAQEVRHGACRVDPAASVAQCRVQKLPTDDPQSPRQALKARTAVGRYPASILRQGLLCAPHQGVHRVVDSRHVHVQQLLCGPLRRERPDNLLGSRSPL